MMARLQVVTYETEPVVVTVEQVLEAGGRRARHDASAELGKGLCRCELLREADTFEMK